MSDSPDLARLGLLREHVDLAVAELARTVMVEGGRLMYGGDFRLAGFTPFLIKEVERWATQDQAYLYLCLASSVHRKMNGDEIENAKNLAGHFGEVLWLDDGGKRVEEPLAGRVWACP
jgi:hypothetical protein